MENVPAVFTNEVFGSLTVITGEDNKPVFLAKEVAEALDYRTTGHLTRSISEEYKGIHFMDTLGGKQKLATINEYGIIESVLKARKPEAKAFQKWVIEDIIPSVLKTGEYINEDLKRQISLTQEHRDHDKKVISSLHSDNTNLKKENKNLIVEAVNEAIEHEEETTELKNSRRGLKGQETRKRRILDEIKGILSTGNDRDVVSALERVMEDYVDMKKVIHGPDWEEYV